MSDFHPGSGAPPKGPPSPQRVTIEEPPWRGVTVQEVDSATPLSPSDRLQFGVVEEPTDEEGLLGRGLGGLGGRLAVNRGVSIVSVYSDDEDASRSARASVSPGPESRTADLGGNLWGDLEGDLAGQRRLQRLETVEGSVPSTPEVVEPPAPQRAKKSLAEEDEDPALEALLRRVQKQRSVLEEILDKEGEKAQQDALGEGTTAQQQCPRHGPAPACVGHTHTAS